MRLIDWINIGVVVVAIIGAATYIGELRGQLDGLKSQVGQLSANAIEIAEEKAAQRLKTLAKGPTLVDRDFSWSQGSSEVEMIGQSEGFCYLTRITGKFEGGGEVVSIHVKGGSWYLGGRSKQTGVAAHARCWKWPVEG